MNRLIASALAASVTLALPATAFAETLDYDFTMSITYVKDGYGVFNGLKVGDSINVSVILDSKATGDGNAQISIAEVAVTGTGSWASSWYDVQYDASRLYWDAYSGSVAGSLIVNGVRIDHTVSYQQELYLDFSEVPGGEPRLNTGWLDIRLENGTSSRLKAQYVEPPTSVPELDPKSGTSAIALLVGGMALAFSRRRRQQCDGVAG